MLFFQESWKLNLTLNIGITMNKFYLPPSPNEKKKKKLTISLLIQIKICSSKKWKLKQTNKYLDLGTGKEWLVRSLLHNCLRYIVWLSNLYMKVNIWGTYSLLYGSLIPTSLKVVKLFTTIRFDPLVILKSTKCCISYSWFETSYK